ncbi:MAG TPA: hypothetical protein VHK01_00375 [Lacipirellulaceae bacterium]|nr:hypothetical protein [Lacipirellulaceae bacterium]
MPRYYFDFWTGNRVVPDEKGVECEDVEAAYRAASKALLDLAKDIVPETTRCELSMEVSDEAKKPVCRATLQFEIEQLGEHRDGERIG